MAETFNYIIEFLTVGHIVNIIYVLNLIIAFVIIFVDKKDPSATMAWIMILFIVPVVGFVFYMVFSQHISRLKIDKVPPEEMRLGTYMLEEQMRELNSVHLANYSKVLDKWKAMVMLNLDYSGSILTANESVEIITDGKHKFHKLFDDIRNAEKSICLCYFIIKNDIVGKKLISLLTKKAAEGVEVRLLMDAMGSKQITRFQLKEFEEAGGKYAFYFKPRIRHLFIRFNYRNHRKIAVIDNRIGYIGGFNVAREYAGYKKRFGYWRDTHIRIIGDAVKTMNYRFFLDWRYATNEQFDFVNEVRNNPLNLIDGDIPIQVVSCGPNSPREEIKLAMMKMITGAKSRVFIQTPYFVPDKAIMESLLMAARSGVEVNLMIPCMPDHPFVYRTTLYNAGELLKEGAHVYIYENGFLHAKTLSVDGEVCTVGSTNFDIRSFKLNFETNAFIYDSEVSKRMEAFFIKDLEKSRPYTLEDRANISTLEKALESISRLLTEIL